MYPVARAYREKIFYDHMAAILNEFEEVLKWFKDYHKLLWYMCAFNP
jgi:hypothetical protein